ncbi:MAG: hypothetical protein IJD13_06305, partial [Oscillospiraceae bacterium]|nr:hypothetical protein [Oscillospiraceae bacterium]
PNTTALIHTFISDICENSSPTAGIRMSEEINDLLNRIKRFNNSKIYHHERLTPYKKYADLVIRQIFDTLYAYYNPACLWDNLRKARSYAPKLIEFFEKFLAQRCLESNVEGNDLKLLSRNSNGNETYATPYSEAIYIQAILDYIAGMTDRFAITVHNELLQY